MRGGHDTKYYRISISKPGKRDLCVCQAYTRAEYVVKVKELQALRDVSAVTVAVMERGKVHDVLRAEKIGEDWGQLLPSSE